MLETSLHTSLHTQLTDRRQRLQRALPKDGSGGDLVQLLRDVDRALQDLDGNAYGICEVCGESVQVELLSEHPLLPYCLCDITPERLSSMERDLNLAWRIQSGLLPKQDLAFAGWETHFRYQPLGPVSGDYCDLVVRDGGDPALHFMLGDVTGKGVAASFLMSHLNALFRSLIELDLPLARMTERANRIFTESTISTHYATLINGVARRNGELEICNAGHPPPVVIRGDELAMLDATGMPMGLFDGSPYEVRRLRLDPGDTVLLYSDGLSEARNADDEEFGDRRLLASLKENAHLPPADLAAVTLQELSRFLDGRERKDDLTVLVLRRL